MSTAIYQVPSISTNDQTIGKTLTVGQSITVDGYSAALSLSNTGTIRFNPSNNHLEFSENGGSYNIFGSGGGSLSIGSTVGSGTSKSILFIDSYGNLAQDNTNFAYDLTTHRFDIGAGISFAGSSLAISASNTGRIRYNSSSQQFEQSANGSAYAAFGGAGGGTQNGSTTANHIPYASGSNILNDTGMTWDNTNKILAITTLDGYDSIQITDGTRTSGFGITSTTIRIGSKSNHPVDFFTNDGSSQLQLTTDGAFKVFGSTAAVSASSTGTIRYNSGTNHFEFSENGGSYSVFPGSTLASIYSTGTGQASSTITLDGTRLGIRILDNGSALGSDLFRVAGSGNTPTYFSTSATGITAGTNFTWDNTTFRLTLGTLTNTPTGLLHASGNSGSQSQMRMDNTSSSVWTMWGSADTPAVGFIGTLSSHPFAIRYANSNKILLTSGTDFSPASNGLVALGTNTNQWGFSYFQGIETKAPITATIPTLTVIAPPWINVVGGVGYQNGYIDFGLAGFATTSFYKDALGYTVVRLAAKSGTNGTTVFTLPAGYRPLATLQLPASVDGNDGAIVISASGAIQAASGGNTWVINSCFRFPAEQ